MIKALIFDCFGVLISDGLSNLVNELDDPRRAADITSLVEAASKGQLDANVARIGIAEALGLSPDQYAQAMRTSEAKNIALLAWIKDLRSTYKIGLLSNVMSGGLEVRFSADELSLFDAVVASGDIGIAKPEAEAFTITAERLSVTPAECVMIDDRQDFCEAAKATGMQAVVYRNLPQLRRDLTALL